MERNVLWLVVFAAAVLTGCSSGPKAKGPVLVSFGDRQRASIEPALQGKSGSNYSTIADKLTALPNEVMQGQDVPVSETILNDGLPGKGIRLLVRGTAVSDGLLGLPKEATVKGIFADKKHADVEFPVHFASDATGGWSATEPDIAYGSQLDVNIITSAVKGGEGDLQLLVQPLDKGGTSSVVISHVYKVMDERDPADIQVPTD